MSRVRDLESRAFALHQEINSEACENAPELFGKCASCNVILATLRAVAPEPRGTTAGEEADKP